MCGTGHQSDSEPQEKLCEKAFFEIVKDLDKWFSGWKMSQFQHKKPTTTLPPLLFSSKWPKMRSNMSLMASSFEKLSLTTMISFSIFCFSSNGQVQFHLAVVKWCLLAKKPCKLHAVSWFSDPNSYFWLQTKCKNWNCLFDFYTTRPVVSAEGKNQRKTFLDRKTDTHRTFIRNSFNK